MEDYEALAESVSYDIVGEGCVSLSYSHVRDILEEEDLFDLRPNQIHPHIQLYHRQVGRKHCQRIILRHILYA